MTRLKLALILFSIIHFMDFNSYSLYGKMTIEPLTILEKTRKATYIVHVKLIDIGEETFKVYTTHGPQNVPVITKRYGYYKIIEIVKGKLNGDSLKIDYRKINNSYRPGYVSAILQPEENEETILFLYEGLNFVKGYQGKIRSDRNNLDEYMEAIKLCLSYDLLAPEEKIDKAIDYITSNSILRKSMYSEVSKFESVAFIEYYSKLLKYDDFFLQSILINRLLFIDRKNPGSVQDPEIFDDLLALAKNPVFLNKNQVVIEALGYFKIKKAIPFLEESIKNENRLIRKVAERALAKIRE